MLRLLSKFCKFLGIIFADTILTVVAIVVVMCFLLLIYVFVSWLHGLIEGV